MLAALALIVTPGACNAPDTNKNGGSFSTTFPMSLVDDLGRTVTVSAVPQRIISLAPSNTEIIYTLGLENRLVGVTAYCDYPPEAMAKDKVGDYSMIDLEKVVSLRPDLVLAEDIHKTDIVPALERLGIPCYVPVPHSVDEVVASIAAIGRLTGANAKAQEVVTDMQHRIKGITDKTGSLADSQRPSVMYVVWHDPLMSVGVNTPIDDMIVLAGGANIIKNTTGWPTLSLEEVIAVSPEVVIANVENYPGGDAPLQAILTEPRLRTVRAVSEGRVYGIDASLSNRPVPRMIEGLEWFAALIHPELFPEFVTEYGHRLD